MPKWIPAFAVLLGLVTVPSPALAACETTEQSGGGVDIDGRLIVGKKRSHVCLEDGSGTSPYPRTYWTTADIFWGATEDCPDGMVEGIRRYWVVTGPGAEPIALYDAPACVPLPEFGDGGTLDALDIEAILRGVLPAPAVARDPYADGLVGLETYLWYAGGALTEVDHDGDASTPPRYGWTGTATRDGITITATLYVESFSWQVEPGREVSATSPGTPDEPAASHTYRADGTYELVASTTWAGSYSWTIGAPAGAAPDAAASLSGTGTLNGVTLSSEPTPFRVREIRAVPAEPDVSDR